MDVEVISKYAVLTCNTKMRLYQSPDIQIKNDDNVDTKKDGLNNDEILINAGALIKVFQSKTPPRSNQSGGYKNSSTVQILELVNRVPIYDENLYECPQANLLRVNEDLWPYIINIVDTEQRLRLLHDKKHCNWLLSVKPNDLVTVSGEMFGKSNSNFACIVRYVGTVSQLYPVGYFFGVEILDLTSGHSPQADKISFSSWYMETDPSLAIFATGNWLSPLPTEQQKKFSYSELISGTIEKVKSVIGPSSSLTGILPSNTSSLKRDKKPKKQQQQKAPSSQFYDNIEDTTNTTDSCNNNNNNNKNMDRSSKKESSINTIDNQEFIQSIENREKSIERRATTNTVQTQTQPQSGILKNKNKDQTKSTTIAQSNEPEIVYIKDEDINESTRQKNNIIIVDKPSDVDLVELLGTHWPGNAGEMLNKPMSSSTSKNNRNNSSNILSQLGGNNAKKSNDSSLSDVDLVKLLGTHRSGNAGEMLNKPMSSSTSKNNRNKSSNILSHLGENNAKKSNDSSLSDVDLVELLGTHWPGNAGEMLNKPMSSSTSKNNRNKSSNVLSYLGGNNAKKSNDSSLSNAKNMENKKIQKSNNNRSIQENYDNVDREPLYANTNSNQNDIDAAIFDPSEFPTVLENEFMQQPSQQEVPNTDLGLGSMVEVNVPESNEHLYGVIRWIGTPNGSKNLLIGVELEDDCIDKHLVTTDGGFNGISLFKCPVGRGIFVTSDQCSIDRRFLGAEGGAVGNGISDTTNDNKIKTTNGFHDEQQTFGNMECPIVAGAVAPIKCSSLNMLEELCGKFKGIQGHHNSCYLDVTLFSMFAFTPVFDAILYRPPEKDDISHYNEVQTVLREEIVNPLRKNMFVRADRVMKLRQLLDKLSSVSGLTSEEKDPEEFLNCLLSQIMRADPFLKLNSGQDAYYYQLFVEKDEHLSFPSVQQLFEQSFYSSDIKLKEVPSCLIIQMPRFGKDFKMYPRILPSQVLDVTDIIDDSPRQCSVCGKLAEYECRDCFGALQHGIGLESTSYCLKCLETAHMHAKRSNHKNRKLSVPQDFLVMKEHMTVPRLYMELFAVVCIETSHYVTFVKAGSGPDAPWCFFDSMADRKGEQNGYNIPEMITVPDLPQWLSEDGAKTVNETSSNDKMLPEHAKRLFCDAYMCMYQSTDVMMYH